MLSSRHDAGTPASVEPNRSEQTMSTLFQESTTVEQRKRECACYTCGRPVHPKPLALMPGSLRGYLRVELRVDEENLLALDEGTGAVQVIRYFKCAECLGPDEVKRVERSEALSRLMGTKNLPYRSSDIP